MFYDYFPISIFFQLRSKARNLQNQSSIELRKITTTAFSELLKNIYIAERKMKEITKSNNDYDNNNNNIK